MNHIHYPNERTKAGELMSKEKPLIDYVNHSRRTDAEPEYQEGFGALRWVAVAFVCNVLLVIVGVCYG